MILTKVLTPFFLYLSSLPSSWDWRNISGINYLSPIRNQHQIVRDDTLCGICWGMASTSVIADRMNIKMGYNSMMNYLSVQNVLDCIEYKDDCNGGTEVDVYKYAIEKGIPPETCNMYIGKKKRCEKILQCYNCKYDGTCFPIYNYPRLYIQSYHFINDNLPYVSDSILRKVMKNEIMHRGPITCAIYASDNLENYYGKEIYYEYNQNPKSNHVISIVGWGIENDIEYWIVRNSWGVIFGDQGFFRLVTSSFKNNTGNFWNLGIEKECTFPIVGEWEMYSQFPAHLRLGV